MAAEIGRAVSGEVLSVSPEGVLIALPDGATGLIPVSEASPTGIGSARFRVGERVRVRLLGQGDDGRFDLSLLPQELEHSDAFDQEFHRLNHVLRARSPQPGAQRAPRERTQEEEIKHWLKRVETGFARLRKHRAERQALGAQDDEDGGRGAQRDRGHR